MFARTERLLLRPSWPEDAGPLYRAIADEGIVRNLAKAPWPYSFEDALRFVGGEQADLFPNFILYLRTEGGLAGLRSHRRPRRRTRHDGARHPRRACGCNATIRALRAGAARSLARPIAVCEW